MSYSELRKNKHEKKTDNANKRKTRKDVPLAERSCAKIPRIPFE